MIKVTCEVKVYEKDGISCGMENHTILVLSHLIQDDRIEIVFEEGRIVVVADDLIAAIENATNTKRF
jgi:hypothetical protein